MKKIIILFVLLLSTCGCSVKYHLDIDEVEETLFTEQIEITSDDYDDISYLYEARWPFNVYDDEGVPSESLEKVEGVSYYDIKKYHDNLYHIETSFEHTRDRFSHSAGVKSLYPNFKVIESNNTVTLDTGVFNVDKFKDINSLEIEVNVNREVLEHNANRVDGNTYIWKMNGDEIAKKTLQLKYKTDNEVIEKYNWANENPLLVVLITFGSLFLALGIVLFVYRKMR